ncbi:hypothetical protein E2C01_016597 [Portunus trituberculatus]|uniref:Uncharacterized protein n=1 Tax=Portunus trituberculatus TaxID=210409 RepID=A0A5B7DPI2_PORTR|nr:hypothetical protein [Portunus trituberculatus]
MGRRGHCSSNSSSSSELLLRQGSPNGAQRRVAPTFHASPPILCSSSEPAVRGGGQPSGHLGYPYRRYVLRESLLAPGSEKGTGNRWGGGAWRRGLASLDPHPGTAARSPQCDGKAYCERTCNCCYSTPSVTCTPPLLC